MTGPRTFDDYVHAITTLFGMSPDDAERAMQHIAEDLGPDGTITPIELVNAVHGWQAVNGIAGALQEGWIKLVGYDEQGEAKYSLTNKGQRHAEGLFRRKDEGE